jgi:hypothetical protein
MGKKHVLILNEAEAAISLTQIEVDYIIAVTKTKGVPVECKRGTRTSTQANLVMKIRRVTGWGEMRPTQMFCRFAYKHGLVEL